MRPAVVLGPSLLAGEPATELRPLALLLAALLWSSYRARKLAFVLLQQARAQFAVAREQWEALSRPLFYRTFRTSPSP